MNSLWAHPIPYHSYLDEVYPFHLRIRDIIQLDVGETIELLCLGDSSEIMHHPENKVMSISKFFNKERYGTYTHNNNIQGKMKFKYNYDFSHIIDDFEFDLEWTPHEWFTLYNGKLISDYDSALPTFYENMSWTAYDHNTRIGWRGPMIPKKYFKYLPKIYRMNESDFQLQVNSIINGSE